MTQTKPNRDLEIYRYTQFIENIAPDYKYPNLLIFTKKLGASSAQKLISVAIDVIYQINGLAF